MTTAEHQGFPAIELALKDPDGLLAVGGDLSVTRLVEAYSQGIFPWYQDDEPIMWWSPNQRAVIVPDQVHVSRSLKKTLRKNSFRLSINHDFDAVINHCAAIPRECDGTWINEEMLEAYKQLHLNGHAHSFEVWDQEQLIGGLYGVVSGKVFSGESMFHLKTDASKIAFVFTCLHLRKHRYSLLDCQIQNDHLASLGVRPINRADFKRHLPLYTGISSSANDDTKRQEDWCQDSLTNSQALLEKINELT